MRRRIGVAIVVGLLGVASLAQAHHSYAMFDGKKPTKLTGVVRDWQWTNPHIFLELLVSENGVSQDYSIEATSPSIASHKLGWSRKMLKPGDTVSVIIAPLKDGRRGGSLVSLFKDGVQLGADQGVTPGVSPGEAK